MAGGGAAPGRSASGKQAESTMRPNAVARAASLRQKKFEQHAAKVAACRLHEAAADPVEPLTLADARTFWAEGNLDEALQLLPTCKAHAEVLVGSYNEVQGKLVMKRMSQADMVDSVRVSESCNYRHTYSFRTPRNGRYGWNLSCFEPHTCHGEAESRGRANPAGPAQSGDRSTGCSKCGHSKLGCTRCDALRKGQFQESSVGVDTVAAAARPPKRKATRPLRVVRGDTDSGGKRLRTTVFLDKPAFSIRELLEENPASANLKETLRAPRPTPPPLSPDQSLTTMSL